MSRTARDRLDEFLEEEFDVRRPQRTEMLSGDQSLEWYTLPDGTTVLVQNYGDDPNDGFDVYLPASDSIEVDDDIDAIRGRVRAREQEGR